MVLSLLHQLLRFPLLCSHAQLLILLSHRIELLRLSLILTAEFFKLFNYLVFELRPLFHLSLHLSHPQLRILQLILVPQVVGECLLELLA